MMERVIFTCQPDQGLAASENPCFAVNGVHSAPALVPGYLLSADQGTSFESMNQPFDYALASGFWALSFTSVIALWSVAKASGTVLSFIRRG